MNNQQTNQDQLINVKLLNKLANAEYTCCQLEVQNDELKQQVQQLTEANQRLEAQMQEQAKTE